MKVVFTDSKTGRMVTSLNSDIPVSVGETIEINDYDYEVIEIAKRFSTEESYIEILVCKTDRIIYG